MSQTVKDFEEPEITSDVDRMRHSCAHIMAHAIQELFPKAQFGIGPTIENGFYYDVALDHPLSPEDLKKIESQMKRIIKKREPFVCTEHATEDAKAFFTKLNQPFKVEIIETLEKEMGAKSVTSYQEGDFVDLCRGPHVEHTGQIGAFKLLSVAGAYWRGDENRPQLQRIYGTAFQSKEELKEYLHLLEEAKRRDHRKLGVELDLFSFHAEAPAMPFFHPKGAGIYRRLTQYMRQKYEAYGYQEVITPQILDVSLWKKSGHYDHYRENMYFTEIDDRSFAVKPMNCPSHTFIFSEKKRSYKELPLRIADFGRLHRYERSGVTAGLTRVRSFCQDDAHIFCTPEQIQEEILSVSKMIFETYEDFDFTTSIFLSTRPEDRVGDDSLWDQAEQGLQGALDELGKPYEINPGDGAFYGPKIDFQVQDALKRKHQLSTIQLDFTLPERFDLKFVGADNTLHRPVMIHRAVLGSLERFMGLLIEHTAGAFPFWLTPIQARLIPITDAHLSYCQSFADELRRQGCRVEIDDRNESMGMKTRDAQKSKVPFSLVAGDREVQDHSFSVRKYGQRDSETWTQETVLKTFRKLNRILEPLPS